MVDKNSIFKTPKCLTPKCFTLRPIGNIGKHSRKTGTFIWGLLKLALFADRYTWEFVAVDGQTLADTGNASCVRRR